MLDKTIKELWDLGVTARSVFEKSGDYIILQIEKDGKIHQRMISYTDLFFGPGDPSLEGTLNRYFEDVLYCIVNGLKLSAEWTLVED